MALTDIKIVGSTYIAISQQMQAATPMVQVVAAPPYASTNSKGYSKAYDIQIIIQIQPLKQLSNYINLKCIQISSHFRNPTVQYQLYTCIYSQTMSNLHISPTWTNSLPNLLVVWKGTSVPFSFMAVKSVSAISQRPALPQPFMAQLYATGDFQLFVPRCLLAISKIFDKVGNQEKINVIFWKSL